MEHIGLTVGTGRGLRTEEKPGHRTCENEEVL